ncbi:MAG: ribose-5-phosphate isomerase RpiA [Bacteroidetes bacterium]|nr:ribose-5-phosphate isomerase RpiA [Bacteroidota bacterium]
MTKSDLIKQKKAAAEKAVEFIESGMLVGLGTGSTVKFMIEGLAEKIKNGLDVKTVSTSNATSNFAESLGITVLNFNDVEEIDITIDGADEVDPNLNGIKGGGGALLNEKIVASSSKKNIWMVDSTKHVELLGRFPLPVEVVPFGVNQTLNKLFLLGYKPEFRSAAGKNYVTDGNHYIIDLHLNKIKNPAELNNKLLLIPGVVDTGLFLEVCDVLIISADDECKIILKT